MAIVQRAYQLQQSGDYAGAASAYRAFLKVRPDEVGAHSNLGVVLTKLGKYDEAISEYEAADKLLPGDPRIGVNLALAYEKSGRLPEGMKRLESLYALFSQEQQIRMLLADAYLQAGENSRVIDLLQPLEQKVPDDLAVAYMLGTALIREKRMNEGQLILDRILKHGDSSEARFLLGMQMYEAGDFPATVKQFETARDINPKLSELEAYYGAALLTTGDPDGAAAAFRLELAENPNNYRANLGLGQILAVRKKYSEAQPLLEKALLVRPGAGEANLALGQCFNGEGKFSEARKRLEVAEKTMPDSVDVHRELAVLYGRLNLVKEAGRERGLMQEKQPPTPGPNVNEAAPDFRLPDVSSGAEVSLRDFHGKSAVVLIFGSYTCPNFRASASALKSLESKYGRKAPFLLIYIREAHAGGEWQSTRNERERVTLPEVKVLSDKQEHAAMCSRSLHLPFPALVDRLDDKVQAAYGAWPSRAFVIDREGRVRYSTRLTELDFSATEMDAALQRATQ